MRPRVGDHDASTGCCKRGVQDLGIANLVGQQQHQPGIEQMALLGAQALMAGNQRFVELVVGQIGGLGLEHGRLSQAGSKYPCARAMAATSCSRVAARQRAQTC